MRQLADISNTPISALAGDGVIHHFRKRYNGNLILNVGIERVRLDAPLNERRPEGYYGSSAAGYTDYPFLKLETAVTASDKSLN